MLSDKPPPRPLSLKPGRGVGKKGSGYAMCPVCSEILGESEPFDQRLYNADGTRHKCRSKSLQAHDGAQTRGQMLIVYQGPTRAESYRLNEGFDILDRLDAGDDPRGEDEDDQV